MTDKSTAVPSGIKQAGDLVDHCRWLGGFAPLGVPAGSLMLLYLSLCDDLGEDGRAILLAARWHIDHSLPRPALNTVLRWWNRSVLSELQPVEPLTNSRCVGRGGDPK
jgi:hypothetical protein